LSSRPTPHLTGPTGGFRQSLQSPDMKPKKRRRFGSFSDPLASSNHCSARLDQNSRSSPSTEAAANLPHSFSASNIRIYRGLRADQRTAFLAEFLLAAAARFDTLRAFTRDVCLETRETFGALRLRTTAIAAGAFCPTVIGATSSCALISTGTVSGIKGLDVVCSGTPLANDRISLNASALCACHPCCTASSVKIHGFNIISISDDCSRVVNHMAFESQCTAGLTVPAVQQSWTT
jgi:hypothetical protein